MSISTDAGSVGILSVGDGDRILARGRRAYVGRVYGRLTVVDYVPSGKPGHHPKLTCRCVCGKTVGVFTTNLTRGLTQSCGCLNDEMRVLNNTTHGLTGVGEHPVWTSMIQRCTNPKHIAFANYGGRGISVCVRWLDFENFLADMGRRPSAGHTLDRYPDQNGNYEPSNCRWATRSEQATNRRNNRLITFGEKTQTVSQWAEQTGLNATTIARRLDLYGYTPEQALTKPLYDRRRSTQHPSWRPEAGL